MDLYDSLGMLNSALQFAGAQLGSSKDKKLIREENQKSRDFQLEMWNKANEYNMPSAVLDRYAKAGIQVNPNYLVTGKYDGGLASLASAPGHSAPNMNSKDLAKYNLFQGYLQAEQFKMQQDLVKSQISLNESQESKNLAAAEESRSHIPANLSENRYIQSLTKAQDNENAWFDISLPVRTELLNIEQAIKAGNAAYVVAQTEKVLQDKENSKILTDLKVFATNEAVRLSWKNYDLSKQELGAKTMLWLKMGDAAERNSKAAWLNALTNGKLASLQKDRFDKFSDAELDILQGKALQLTKSNAWIDILNENAVLKGNVSIQLTESQIEGQELDNLNYYNNMVLDFTKSIFNYTK